MRNEWPDAYVRGVNLACQYCFQESAWICPCPGNQVTTPKLQLCRYCWILFFYTRAKKVMLDWQYMTPWWN